MAEESGGIVLYTSPLCGPCEALKAFLTEQNVRFQVKDVMMDEEAADRLDDHNIRSTPALEVDGRFLKHQELERAALRDILAARRGA